MSDMRQRMRLSLVLLACLALPTLASAQVVDPTEVAFTCSPDQATLTRYDARSVVVATGLASGPVSAGLPTPVGSICTISISTALWQPGVEYRVEVRSVRSTAVSAWVDTLRTAHVTYVAPSPTGDRGPQLTITCPSGSVAIGASATSATLQTAVNANVASTTFCIAAGTHVWTSAVTPKTGNVFVGEYGAILDGSTWSSSDSTQGAFRAHNQNIDTVTIRNLVIRSMPQDGIHAYKDFSDAWTIDHNEITTCRRTGLNVGTSSLVRDNYIHHNTSGGYLAYRGNGASFLNNEIAYNGAEQKIVGAAGATFSGNFVHHNVGDGIWYDTDNTSSVIDGNQVEDNGRHGIHYEISGSGEIRNNDVLRSGDTGIFISTSKSVSVHTNTLTNNFRGIQMLVNCSVVGSGLISWDLKDDQAYDNDITVGATSGAWASTISNLSSCTSLQLTPYLNGSKNLTYTNNDYHVPNTLAAIWFHGLGVSRTFLQWQGLGFDTTGSVD